MTGLPNIVVMGVSGSGKSTLARALAIRLGSAFCEGDDLHPVANRQKMAAGIPLSDDDRWPWLDRVADWLQTQAALGIPGVVTCSALKQSYRERLTKASPGLLCVMLAVDRNILAARVSDRPGHFMPASLLDSQLATLEPLATDGDGTTLDGSLPVDALIAQILVRLKTR